MASRLWEACCFSVMWLDFESSYLSEPNGKCQWNVSVILCDIQLYCQWWGEICGN